jgi:hypothetical protein
MGKQTRRRNRSGRRLRRGGTAIGEELAAERRADGATAMAAEAEAAEREAVVREAAEQETAVGTAVRDWALPEKEAVVAAVMEVGGRGVGGGGNGGGEYVY